MGSFLPRQEPPIVAAGRGLDDRIKLEPREALQAFVQLAVARGALRNNAVSVIAMQDPKHVH